MSFWLWGAALALLGGVAIGALNYLLSCWVLRRSPAHFSSVSVLRQLLQVGYLLVLFFVAPYTPWEQIPLLVGGVIGVTVAMFYFTGRLVRLNGSHGGTPPVASDTGEPAEPQESAPLPPEEE